MVCRAVTLPIFVLEKWLLKLIMKGSRKQVFATLQVIYKSAYLATFPHIHGVDGAFGARLRKATLSRSAEAAAAIQRKA
jgi:hypothetical protein